MYALLIPLLILFVGVGLDLGWYFLTVSRMQHAADAAVVAGAAKLLTNKEDTIFSDYTAAQLISKVPHYLTSASITSEIYTGDGDEVAKTYVKKNMATDNSDWNDNTIADSWTKKDLTFGRTLWGSDERDFKTLYYQVVLRQEVGHLFLGGFTPMTAVVSSVAKITRYEMGDTLFNQMSRIRDENTYPSWSKIRDVNQERLFNANPAKYNNINKYDGQLKNDSDAAADNRSVLTSGVWYTDGDHYREEILTLNNIGGRIKETTLAVVLKTIPNASAKVKSTKPPMTTCFLIGALMSTTPIIALLKIKRIKKRIQAF